jgi:hypothetical protein
VTVSRFVLPACVTVTAAKFCKCLLSSSGVCSFKRMMFGINNVFSGQSDRLTYFTAPSKNEYASSSGVC